MTTKSFGFPQIAHAASDEGSTASTSAPSSTPSPPTSPSTSAPSLPPSETKPVGTTTLTEPSDGGAADFDVSALFGDTEVLEAPVAPAPVALTLVAQPPVAAAVPAQPPVGTEPPKPAVPAPAAVSTAAATTPAPTEQPSPQLDPADPANLSRLLTQHEAEAIPHIAQTLFKLSDAEIEALESNAVETIPTLLAKGYVKAQQNFLAVMAKTVPLMISRHLQVTKANSKHEAAFAARWPDIDLATHTPLIARVALQYRRENPSVPAEQMIEEVGAIVRGLAKLPAEVTKPNGNGITAPSPMTSVAGRPPQPSPFQPAGAGVAAAPTQVEASPWDFLDPANEV